MDERGTTQLEREFVRESIMKEGLITDEVLVQKIDANVRYGRRMLDVANGLQTSLFPKAFYFNEAANAFKFVSDMTQWLAERSR